MPKIAEKYLEVDPWIIKEKGFHADRSEVSESIFSLGNEFMGVRGYFEEGCSIERFVGSFFNGIFEEEPINHPVNYNGFPRRFHFMVNSFDWLYTRIRTGKEELDLGKSKFSEFSRSVDLREGIVRRSFIWHAPEGDIKVEFERLLSMVRPNLGLQTIKFSSISFSGKIDITLGIDASNIQHNRGKCFWNTVRKTHENDISAIMAKTPSTRQSVFCSMKILAPKDATIEEQTADQLIAKAYTIELGSGQEAKFERVAANFSDKKIFDDNILWQNSIRQATELTSLDPELIRTEHIDFWKNIWTEQDAEIEGDPENQQGVRFCIFQLNQTYHGVDPSLNVSAKGLTGEEYHGHTWWDTETYCLPFYIFNNQQAAKNLLEYRYLTLPQAKERAIQKGCKGARYPMETIDGTEACSVWQHGDLEIHVSVAVAYGIWHYTHLTQDTDFLYGHGIEMLVEICRYYASRGGWSQQNGEYGFWCVMGPDEFHMMVNNNCYTNYMVKKAFEYTVSVLSDMQSAKPAEFSALMEKLNLQNEEKTEWQNMAVHMRISQNSDGIYEQHDGYFDMPHTDIDSIPENEFPIYKNWSYYRIFRTDMIKQPDVLLFMFFYAREFSDQIKKLNFDFYESRCSHESSLSPGVHSILAAELGMNEKAFKYWGYAARLDLDDYNNNTHEGLHTTSMAAAWMNVIFGFGGLRTDAETLVFKPIIPESWKAFSFHIQYRGSLIKIKIDHEQAEFKIVKGNAVNIQVFDKKYEVGSHGIIVPMK